MSFQHIPQGTPILSYFKGNEGKDDKPRLMQWLKGEILSRDLNELDDIKSQIVKFYKDGRGEKNRSNDEASNANDLGQKLGSISNFLGKVRNQWENKPADVTDEQHKSLTDALVSFEKCKELWRKYVDEAKALRKPRENAREKGQSAPREKDHPWQDIYEKGNVHVKNMMEFLLKSSVSSTDKTKIRDAIILATATEMENTRTAFATVKCRNVNPEKDNYILFSEEAYGNSIVVWNVRKGGGGENHKLYNQTIPKKLADILKRYSKTLSVSNGEQDFLIPFDTSKVWEKDTDEHKKGDEKTLEEYLDARQDAYRARILKVTKDILDKSIGIQDMRRIQITEMGLPETEYEVERLALKFHHTANEHRKYFRTAHKRAAGAEEGPSNKKSKPNEVVVVD